MVSTTNSKVGKMKYGGSIIGMLNLIQPIMSRLYNFDISTYVTDADEYQCVNVYASMKFTNANLKHCLEEFDIISGYLSMYNNIEITEFTNNDIVSLSIHYDRDLINKDKVPY